MTLAPVLSLPRRWPKRIALLLLALFFVSAGVSHFTRTEFFVSIVPPYLPAPLALVYVSGLCEIAGGLAVLAAPLRSLAGWALVALLFAVFPANVHMALHPEAYPATPAFALHARLPVQLLLVAWAWWCTRPDRAG
jgi:uncharacterized membrane protein